MKLARVPRPRPRCAWETPCLMCLWHLLIPQGAFPEFPDLPHAQRGAHRSRLGPLHGDGAGLGPSRRLSSQTGATAEWQGPGAGLQETRA